MVGNINHVSRKERQREKKNRRYQAKTHYVEVNDTPQEDSTPLIESLEFSESTIANDDANTEKQTNYTKKQFHRQPVVRVKGMRFGPRVKAKKGKLHELKVTVIMKGAYIQILMGTGLQVNIVLQFLATALGVPI